MSYVVSVGGDPINPQPYTYSNVTLDASQEFIWPNIGLTSDYVATNWVDITASGTGYTVTLPPANEVGIGAEVVFNNYGSNTFDVEDNSGGSITTIGTGNTIRIWVTDNTTVDGAWRTANIGSGSTSADASALAGLGLKAIGSTLNADSPVFTLSSMTPVSASNRAQAAIWSGGVGTVSFDTAATLTDGWWMYVKNRGSGILTLDPDGVETIDGESSLSLSPNESCIVLCNGSNLYTVGLGRTVTSTDSRLQLSVAGNSNVTLTSTQYANNIMDFTGVLTGDINIIFPNVVKNYFVTNDTTGFFSITCKTSGGSGVVIQQGGSAIITCDASNVTLE